MYTVGSDKHKLESAIEGLFLIMKESDFDFTDLRKVFDLDAELIAAPEGIKNAYGRLWWAVMRAYRIAKDTVDKIREMKGE